eukprot:926386-Prymnesium_polylepis.1
MGWRGLPTTELPRCTHPWEGPSRSPPRLPTSPRLNPRRAGGQLLHGRRVHELALTRLQPGRRPRGQACPHVLLRLRRAPSHEASPTARRTARARAHPARAPCR